MAKKAVLIECNYQGTKAELKGCINDVRRMHRCLIDRYGFSDEDITVLIDTDDSYTQPTGRNVRRALTDLIRSASVAFDFDSTLIDSTMSNLTLFEQHNDNYNNNNTPLSSYSLRWIARKRRRRGSRSVSGRSSDRNWTRRRCCSVGASAAYATCSDFMVANGIDSSGELFVSVGGDVNWGSDVSEAAKLYRRRLPQKD